MGAERMKNKLIWAVAAGKKQVQEDLCVHLDRFSTEAFDACPVQAGEESELRFAFEKLPQVVMAGTYELTFSSVDPVGNQIACVKGSLTIAPGEKGEMFRKLQSSPFSAETCGSESDLMKVKSVHFDHSLKAAV